MFPLIYIPQKQSRPVDWCKLLSKQIVDVYQKDPKTLQNEFAQLTKMRDLMLSAGELGEDSAKEVMMRYYGQLEMLEIHFTFDEDVFRWKDAFTQEEKIQSSLAFEKASVIFNISAMLSKLAMTLPRDPTKSFQNLQVSSGLLNYIKENFLHAPSKDLSAESITFLSDLMLAQAQEMVFEKIAPSPVDLLQSKDEKTVNRVALVLSGLYNLYSCLRPEKFFPKQFFKIIESKVNLYLSLRDAFHGALLKLTNEHGKAVFVMEQAVLSIKKIDDFDIKPLKAVLVDCFEKYERENKLIYSKLVQKPEPLNPVIIAEKHSFDKLTTNGLKDLRIQDLFKGLIPVQIHEKSSVYSEKKDALLRTLKEKQQDLEERIKLSNIKQTNNLVQEAQQKHSNLMDVSSKVQRHASQVLFETGNHFRDQSIQLERIVQETQQIMNKSTQEVQNLHQIEVNIMDDIETPISQSNDLIAKLETMLRDDDISELLCLNANLNIEDHIFKEEMQKFDDLKKQIEKIHDFVSDSIQQRGKNFVVKIQQMNNLASNCLKNLNDALSYVSHFNVAQIQQNIPYSSPQNYYASYHYK